MKPIINVSYLAVGIAVLLMAFATNTLAQEAKLSIHVTPEQAYIFVDGHAIGEASKHHSLSLSPGEHKIDVANYGYSLESRNVSITAGNTSSLEVTLTPVTGQVPGPFGAMTIEGANRDAVLLNGKTPEFYVGHGDEFNHEWWWKQELVVPPGNYQVTIQKADQEVWSGPVDVAANQRLVVDIPTGVRKTVDWPRGGELGSIPRFTMGTASATVAVAKPTAELSVAAAQVNCGDSSQLKWTSSDAPKVEINPVGPVATSGEQAIQPKQTTTYNLTAIGPGGTVTSSATINVNNSIQANLDLSPAEIQYRRVGDKVVEEGGTALNWKVTNASMVSIDPLGTVDPNGNRTLQLAPRKTDPGTVDENVVYTLSARNDCGGAETRTATLHIVGLIEPEPRISMRSVYFPTDQPQTLMGESGLLPSERETLISIADAYKKYLAFKPDAHLVLAGHADERGPQEYNQPLSERRAQLAKTFLMEQGVPEASIETQAYGKEKNLSADDVKKLLEQSPDLSAEARQKAMQKLQTIVLAHNRRVDIILTPAGEESAARYPFTADDYAILIDRNGPERPTAVQPAALKEKVPN